MLEFCLFFPSSCRIHEVILCMWRGEKTQTHRDTAAGHFRIAIMTPFQNRLSFLSTGRVYILQFFRWMDSFTVMRRWKNATLDEQKRLVFNVQKRRRDNEQKRIRWTAFNSFHESHFFSLYSCYHFNATFRFGIEDFNFADAHPVKCRLHKVVLEISIPKSGFDSLQN